MAGQKHLLIDCCGAMLLDDDWGCLAYEWDDEELVVEAFREWYRCERAAFLKRQAADRRRRELVKLGAVPLDPQNRPKKRR
ncbi:MAG: hypothetical protein FJ189_02535 [Gammaproteobacteria bacterium]|nr:hypothetical protein [Gammaproteobacteria bacterium]